MKDDESIMLAPLGRLFREGNDSSIHNRMQSPRTSSKVQHGQFSLRLRLKTTPKKWTPRLLTDPSFTSCLHRRTQSDNNNGTTQLCISSLSSEW